MLTDDRRGCVEHAVAPWSLGSSLVENHGAQTMDWIAEECAVALVYNGVSHGVMMASPVDLNAFALGFSYTEGVIDKPDDIYDIQLVEHRLGLALEISISAQCFMRLKEKNRSMAGRTGCGICGVESLEKMQVEITPVDGEFVLSHAQIDKAVKQFTRYQPLQGLTGAVHGAAWCDKSGDIVRVCEDVGRHNALDKLIGSLLGQHVLNEPGFLLISSRASYEIVQKAARANMAVVVAMSAPTSLAISVAEQSLLTLVGFSRADRHVIYTQGHRVRF